MDIEQISVLLCRMAKQPNRILAYGQSYRSSRENTLHRRRINEYEKFKVPLERAIAEITDTELFKVQAILSDVSLKDFYIETHDPIHTATRKMGGSVDTNLAFCLYAICRLIRPSVVIETGVSYGISSAFILKALDENKNGHLYSVDLPALRVGAKSSVGISIPERLRGRWTLILDFSKYALPKLFSSVGTVDMFLSDSEHTYHNQRMEHTLAYKYLVQGGVLLEDDVITSDAFLELCEANRLHPFAVRRFLETQDKVCGPFGLVRK